jgi:hypothetical protein
MLKRISAALLAAVVYLASLPIAPVVATVALVPLTACSSALDFANAFIASATAIVNADPTAPYVPALNQAIQSMKDAEANWNGSSVNCALTSAANTAVQIIDQIVPGSPVALIATVAVAGFDALAAVLFPCTTTATALTQTLTTSVITLHSLRSTVSYTHYRASIQGAIFKLRAYTKAFNGAAKDSGLAVRI